MTEFRMPSLGADMEDGTLVEWKIHPGEKVRRGDIVAVVETAKGAIEIEIFQDGVVAELFVAPGTKVPVGAVLARPHLWVTALRQAGRLASPGWWRRPPFLPLPDPDYLAFRMETQYGASDHAPDAPDLVAYLEWCRAQDRELRRRGHPPRR